MFFARKLNPITPRSLRLVLPFSTFLKFSRSTSRLSSNIPVLEVLCPVLEQPTEHRTASRRAVVFIDFYSFNRILKYLALILKKFPPIVIRIWLLRDLAFLINTLNNAA